MNNFQDNNSSKLEMKLLKCQNKRTIGHLNVHDVLELTTVFLSLLNDLFET